MRGSKGWGSVGGGGDGVDGVGGEGGAGGERGAGDGGVGVGDGGGGGVGGEGPSTLRLEKVAASNGCRPSSPWPSLGASQIQEVVKEEGEEGEGVDDPAKHWWWWLPLPRKLGGQLPAGCGGLLL